MNGIQGATLDLSSNSCTDSVSEKKATASSEQLPDFVLGKILENARPEDFSALGSVCKKWRAVAFEGSLRRLKENDSVVEAFRAVLGRDITDDSLQEISREVASLKPKDPAMELLNRPGELVRFLYQKGLETVMRIIARNEILSIIPAVTYSPSCKMSYVFTNFVTRLQEAAAKATISSSVFIVGGNKVHFFPAHIFSVLQPSTVLFDNLSFKKFPASMSMLESVKEVHLHNCPHFSDITSLLTLPNLEKLCVGEGCDSLNRFTIPQGVSKLKSICFDISLPLFDWEKLLGKLCLNTDEPRRMLEKLPGFRRVCSSNVFHEQKIITDLFERKVDVFVGYDFVRGLEQTYKVVPATPVFDLRLITSEVHKPTLSIKTIRS